MRNVVLVILDTVRKDYFDEHATALRSFADIEFKRCYAPSSWSIPSHASMFTGVLPHRHGVHSYNPNYATLDRTFLDDLDHRALGVSANGAVSESFGFDALFDEFYSFAGNDELSPDVMSINEVQDYDGPGRYIAYLTRAAAQGRLASSLRNGLYIKANEFLNGRSLPKIGDSGAAAVMEKALSITTAEPFALFLNFIDAHGPMENRRVLDSEVPSSWSSHQIGLNESRNRSREELKGFLDNYRDLYAANVRYLDRTVIELIREMQARTDRETVFIVTADHGDELRLPGERDLGHMDFSTPLLQVPCVVIGDDTGIGVEVENESDTGENGTSITSPTSLLDIGAVATRLARGDDAPDISRRRAPAERIGMLFYNGDDPYWTRGVRTIYEKTVRYERDTLGNAARINVSRSVDEERMDIDPSNFNDPEFDSDLDAYVAAAQAAGGKTPDLATETMDHLEDLGYKM